MNKFYENGERNATNLRPKTAPCLNVCPVDIEVKSKCNEYTLVPSLTVETEKGKNKSSFWKSLFKERKCPNCSGNCCDCKRKHKTKKKIMKEKTPNYKEVSNKNPALTSQIAQTNENCPTKCTLPINQRGVGCHLYFCIDSKPKKQTKTKKNKKNETIKIQGNCCNLVNEIPQVTLTCDDSKESLEEYSTGIFNGTQIKETTKCTDSEKSMKNCSRNSPYTSFEKSTVPQNTNVMGPQKSVEDGTGKAMFKGKSQTYSVTVQRNVGVFSKPDSDPENKIYNLDSTHYQCIPSKPNSPSRIAENEESGNVSKSVNIGRNEYTNVPKIVNISPRDERYSRVSVLKTTQGSISYPVKAYSPLMPGRPTFDEESTKVKKYNLSNKKLESIDSFDKDSIFTNSSVDKQRKLNRKSINVPKGSFVRNSLITLRREKRQSLLEGRVSLILKKLTDIENKMELIKKCKENNENNVKLGISCDRLKQTVSIKFDDTKSKSNKDHCTSVTIKPSKQHLKANTKEASSVLIKPSDHALKETVRIKSHNNRISIHAPGDVNIKTKNKTKPVEPSKSQQVLYHNSYEIDAHIVGTNSNLTNRSFKCRNPKIVVSYPMKENTNPDSWRKISEELKVSQGNIQTKRQGNCLCDKHC